jgi:hypothetical protein
MDTPLQRADPATAAHPNSNTPLQPFHTDVAASTRASSLFCRVLTAVVVSQGKLHADTMAAIKAQLHQPEYDGEQPWGRNSRGPA